MIVNGKVKVKDLLWECHRKKLQRIQYTQVGCFQNYLNSDASNFLSQEKVVSFKNLDKSEKVFFR